MYQSLTSRLTRIDFRSKNCEGEKAYSSTGAVFKSCVAYIWTHSLKINIDTLLVSANVLSLQNVKNFREKYRNKKV